jgi:hypothetical protein
LVSDGCGFGMERGSEGRIEEGRFTGTLNEGTKIVQQGPIDSAAKSYSLVQVGARQVILRVPLRIADIETKYSFQFPQPPEDPT